MQLVYLSPTPWASFDQRPHMFVKWFHDVTHGKVLWIDPYPTRLPELCDFKRLPESIFPAIKNIPSWLSVLTPRALPIEPIIGTSRINSLFWKKLTQKVVAFTRSDTTLLGIGKPSLLSLNLLAMSGWEDTFYDAMDDFPLFYKGLSRVSMSEKERMVAGQVSKMLVSSTTLRNLWSRKRCVLTARNACSVQELPSPEDCLRTKSEIVIGYIGTMGKWFDWDLVCRIAKVSSGNTIRLIGPNYCAIPKNLPANIDICPSCSHHAAIREMSKFKVGLIPFKKMSLTASVDPIKYYEYRALGIPVVSTDFGEMNYHRHDCGVFVLDEACDIKSVIDSALNHNSSLLELHEFRKKNSWHVRFDSLKLFE